MSGVRVVGNSSATGRLKASKKEDERIKSPKASPAQAPGDANTSTNGDSMKVETSDDWEEPAQQSRGRTMSHYDRLKFGMENDPEAEAAERLAKIERKKAELVERERLRKEKEEEEANGGLFGWIGKSIKKKDEVKKESSSDSSSSDEEGLPNMQKKRIELKPPSVKQQEATKRAQEAKEKAEREALEMKKDDPLVSSSSESESSEEEEPDANLEGEISSSSEEEPDPGLPLVEQLNRKEVLALPSVEHTMRTMARGQYFTFYHLNETQGGARGVASMSVHSHRRISTIDMRAAEREDRGGNRRASIAEQEDDEDYHTLGGTGVNPFFIPQSHSKPVLQKDVFVWVEFPNAVMDKYPADTISNSHKDAKGKVIKNMKLSNVNGGPQETYTVTQANLWNFLQDACIFWCEATKLPVPPKDAAPYRGPPQENPFPTHLPHPRKFKTKHREALSHLHQLRVKKEDQKLPVLDIVDLYTGKKSFVLMSSQLASVSPDTCFSAATKDNSLSFSSELGHLYRLKPYQKPKSKRKILLESKLTSEQRDLLRLKREENQKRREVNIATKLRDMWLLGFASLLSVGRNLVKHRIDRTFASDKVLKVERAKQKKKLRNALNQPKTQGALLVRDAASILKTGAYAKRYYLENHATNDITDSTQQKQRIRRKLDSNGMPLPVSPGKSPIDEEASNQLDGLRRILHYDEIFIFAEFPNDPEVHVLPENNNSEQNANNNPLVRDRASTRAPKGGMSLEDEELDMYGAALYWCEPTEAHLRPRNPNQAIFFSRLEDLYVGKKTEAFVFEHVNPCLCISLYCGHLVLDLQMENEAFRNIWVKSIVALLQLHRVVGAKRDKDASNAQVELPQNLQRTRKASTVGLTPVWHSRRTASRSSMYGSMSIPGWKLTLENDAQQAAMGTNPSPGFPMTPLMLPSSAAGGGSSSSPPSRKVSSADLPEPINFIQQRKTSDFDLGRPALSAGMRKGSDASSDSGAGSPSMHFTFPNEAVIAEGDEKDEEEQKGH